MPWATALVVVVLMSAAPPTADGSIVRLDPTPWWAEEFGPNRLGVASASTAPAAGLVDLWSTLVHELGHVVGLDDDDGGFMTATLVWGERRSSVLWGVGPRIL